MSDDFDDFEKNVEQLEKEIEKELDKLLAEIVFDHHRKLGPNEYRCAVCRQIFFKGLSDEEAAEEYKKEFPDDPPLGEIKTDLVCEDCFQNMKAVGAFR